MSQVGIPRPASMGQKMGVSLPQIEHPLSRMGNPTNMDIRGVSRSGDRPLSHPSGRPLANENVYSGRKSVSAHGRDSRLGSRQMMQAPLPIDSIPEGVEVMYGDPAKTRLPVFGKFFFYVIKNCFGWNLLILELIVTASLPLPIFIWRSESKSRWIWLVREICLLYVSPQKSAQFSKEMNFVLFQALCYHCFSQFISSSSNNMKLNCPQDLCYGYWN